ncbi:MAG: general stress protein CsbD [Flavobacteriales bacterium 32-34-25]|nr:MAG: general stress protein CsbD [Flavobacteriales bacterium 32-34-25]
MNTIEIEGNWEEQKEKLKQKFTALMDNDLLFLDSKNEDMISRLQVKLGKTKEEVCQIIQTL